MNLFEGWNSGSMGSDGVGGRSVLFVLAMWVGIIPTMAGGQPVPAKPPAAGMGSAVLRAQEDAPEAGQQTFASAAEASQALLTALQGNDQKAMLKVLGPGATQVLSSGDEEEDKNDRADFVKKYEAMHRLQTDPDGFTTLYIGAENWPSPIPLAHRGKLWYFDTAAGKSEVLYRRVGENELTVIHVCTEMVDAEKEYYAKPHDGSSVQAYAQKILSGPGKHNGLYWEASQGEPESPLGPFVAEAESEGYPETGNQGAQPFHGYYFRVLKEQGPHAPGGEKSYVVDGQMTGGFAFLAFPAEYRSSGVMTFLVDQDGVVYEKDLGQRTEEIARTLRRYDRDATWRKTK